MSERKNDKLRAAREAMPSRWFPGRAMTRSELAERVVEHVWRHHGTESPFDRKYLAKLEDGRIRYPSARYRDALREILGAGSDAALGFVSANRERVATALPAPRPPAGDRTGGLAAFDPFDDDSPLTPRPAPATRTTPVLVDTSGDADPHIDRDLVVFVLARARRLRELDGLLAAHQRPPDAIVAPPELDRLASTTVLVADELLAGLTELCLLAGWLASDGGHRRDALRYFQAGMRAAHIIGDETLSALFLTALFHREVEGHHRELTASARAARSRILDRISPRVRAGRATMTDVVGEVGWEVRAAPDLRAARAARPPARRDRAREYDAYADWLDEADLNAAGADAAVHGATRVLVRAREAARPRPRPALCPSRIRWLRHVALDEVDELAF